MFGPSRVISLRIRPGLMRERAVQRVTRGGDGLTFPGRLAGELERGPGQARHIQHREVAVGVVDNDGGGEAGITLLHRQSAGAGHHVCVRDQLPWPDDESGTLDLPRARRRDTS